MAPGGTIPKAMAKKIRLRIDEAIEVAKQNGTKVLKKDIAQRIWNSENPKIAGTNMARLVKGTKATVRPEWIATICAMTGVDANFLLGIGAKPVKLTYEQRNEKMHELAGIPNKKMKGVLNMNDDIIKALWQYDDWLQTLAGLSKRK